MNSADWNRVEDLFHRARMLGPAERARFLDESCQGAPDVRREVEALLAADIPVERLFEPGQNVGPYKIVREIGRGGMGVVYLAEDLALACPVALKVLLPDVAGDESRRARFRREAQAHRRLSHPSIATVFAFHDFNGMLCIASEYIEGATVRERLNDGPLPFAEVVSIGIDIAGALAEAADKGIVHRDLKPENVMCSVDGRVKVLDFGLAVLEASATRAGSAPARLTREGAIIGTPSYMSPEQLRGRDVDARSDIFTLGVMLYEMTSGNHPFERADQIVTGARILVDEPEPLSSVVREIPAGFERIVRKCLRKDPAERFQSPRELQIDLEELRGQIRTSAARQGQQAAPAPAIDRRRWWRVHQFVLTAVYAAIVIAAWRATRLDLAGSDLLYAIAICAAAAGGAARMHGVFVEVDEGDRAASKLSRSTAIARVCDWILAALLAVSASLLMRDHRLIAATIVALDVVFAYAFLVIEPATTRRAFPRRISGARRRA